MVGLSSLGKAITRNPVRVYSVAAAVLAAAVVYFPALPVVLILPIVAAVLGLGEGVRAVVTPQASSLEAITEATAAATYKPGTNYDHDEAYPSGDQIPASAGPPV